MTSAQTTILRAAKVAPGSTLAGVVAARANIFDMTQKAEAAVLRPRDAGAFCHALRAALAARIAAQAGDKLLSEHYLADSGAFAPLANPEADGAAQGLGVVLRFVDRVANQTRDVASEDIAALQEAGFGDADIVRLCELVAFLAFQLRVVSGLRLMQGDAT